MKEIRIKIDDQVADTMREEATATNDFVAVMARRIIEDHYKQDKGGIFVKFTSDHLASLSRGAKKCGISMQEYLQVILDKTVPSDKMTTIILNMPKGLDKKQTVEFLDNQFSKLQKKLVK